MLLASRKLLLTQSHRQAINLLAASAMPITTDVRSGPFNWVNGERCNPVDSSKTFNNVEPRTGKVLAAIPASGPQEVNRAVEAASQALVGWKKVRSRLISLVFKA